METKKSNFGFHPENYKLLIIGLVINVIGFLLMIGGAAKNPNEFNKSEIFSSVRITIAPLFIVAGYAVIFFAIMRKPKAKKD
ncbi:MAG: hypothetical protein RIT10_1263 [Bacteroidota bacterium]|jgi:hypothetical protein